MSSSLDFFWPTLFIWFVLSNILFLLPVKCDTLYFLLFPSFQSDILSFSVSELSKLLFRLESSENENENVYISSWNIFSPVSQKHRGGPEFSSNTFGLPCSQTLEFSYIEPNREENLKVSGNWYFALGRMEWEITT